MTDNNSAISQKKYQVTHPVTGKTYENKAVEINLHGTSFEMIYVQGSVFEMGGESWNKSSLTVHKVELSDFWICKYLVTQGLYEAVMKSNPSYYKGKNRPVETVSWKEANVFIEKLNAEIHLLDNKLPSFALPTEAQWEYAAKGGVFWKDGFTYAGGNDLHKVGWYNGNSHRETKPVGMKKPNQLGIFDLTGNVWEWCRDAYDSEIYQKRKDSKKVVLDPFNDVEGAHRVLSGGSWGISAGSCRTAGRDDFEPADRNGNLGFRLVSLQSQQEVHPAFLLS